MNIEIMSPVNSEKIINNNKNASILIVDDNTFIQIIL